MSRVEIAVEKVKHLDEDRAGALLEWLDHFENREALRNQFDREIQTGLDQLSRGEKIPAKDVFSEIRHRSERRQFS